MMDTTVKETSLANLAGIVESLKDRLSKASDESKFMPKELTIKRLHNISKDFECINVLMLPAVIEHWEY